MSDDLPPLPDSDQQGFSSCGFYATDLFTADQMREYAKKAVEAEREACAQACAQACERKGAIKYAGLTVGEQCAAAIRARGNT